jgi:hypothetical protein
MTQNNWANPWKLTTIGLLLVAVTALITGLVVANLSGNQADRQAALGGTPPSPPAGGAPAPPSSAVANSPAPAPPPAVVAPAPRAAPAPGQPRAVPTQASIDACNHYAGAQVGQHDKTADVVKDGAIGAIAGAALGAAGGAIAGGGKGAGKGAAIGGLVGAGGGSLYGLNENQKRDQQYREAYARCMHARGYTG